MHDTVAGPKEAVVGWKAKRGKDVSDSIAARLRSLADLAERAAGRSFLIRWLALCYIWQADSVVRDFVAGSEWNAADRLWSPALPAVRYGTDPADAMNLAASLRALAVVVLDMAAQQRRQSILEEDAFGDGGNDGRPEHDVFQRLLETAFSPAERRDTS